MWEKWLGFYGGSQDSQNSYVDVISVSMDRMWENCWGSVVLGFYGCSQDSQNGSVDVMISVSMGAKMWEHCWGSMIILKAHKYGYVDVISVSMDATMWEKLLGF